MASIPALSSIGPSMSQEGSGDLQEGHPSVTKGASPSAKHPLKVPFTKAWRGLHLRKASRGLHLRKGPLQASSKPPSALKASSPFDSKGASRMPQGGFKCLPWGIREAPFERWRLQAPPFSTLQRWRLQAPFKPPWRSSPLQAPLKPPSSPLEAPFTFGRLQAPLKPPWSPLQAPLKPSEGEAPFKPPWSLPKVKPPSSPLQAPLKPPSSPLQAPLKALFKPPWSLPKVKPPSTFRPSSPPPSPPDPSSPLEGGFWRGYLGTSPACPLKSSGRDGERPKDAWVSGPSLHGHWQCWSMGQLPGPMPASMYMDTCGRLPYTCLTSAMLAPLIEGLPILRGSPAWNWC